MSEIVPIGIDFGNIITRTSKFEINRKELALSHPVIQLNGNGSKETPYHLL